MLSSMIQYPSGPVEDLETNSISGPTSRIGYTHRTDMESSRVDLKLECRYRWMADLYARCYRWDRDRGHDSESVEIRIPTRSS